MGGYTLAATLDRPSVEPDEALDPDVTMGLSDDGGLGPVAARQRITAMLAALKEES